MSGLVLRILGEVFGASWAVLAVLWRPLGRTWAVFWGIPEAPDAPRRPKIIARRTKMASHWQGERSERASAASEASGAIRMKLHLQNTRDAEGTATG